ncbi:SRPBCC family protein [Mesorhizobium sp. B2-4-19]|uniref:SRPBCC family protein n=1 Tax=Mesorhizobium sp. B2-4-19 TaxID=2589930 RepID=UPI00112B0547|nr:SRPBCC family protein [Mesorhizobium sp. B2-4-19]TPK58229.1 SRPBCC family protein [Mesorhizobium sp. B2-4-19]
MLAIIIIIVLVIILAVLIYAATRPNDFVVSRSTSIKAPAEAIFPLINDFKHWPEWSPFEKLDPRMKRTLSGAESGKGAVYAWEGNSKAGAGRMEIVNSVPSSLVALKLDFERPFRANNSVDFSLRPSGDATTVTWAMRGARPFIAKLMGLFMDFDKLIGKDFEAGLANLKQATEQQRLTISKP